MTDTTSQLSSLESASIASDLIKKAAEAAEKKESEKAYLLYEMALQYQPEKTTSRQHMAELDGREKARKDLLPEVNKILEKVLDQKGKKEEAKLTPCPQCKIDNPFGVRQCRCGFQYPSSTSSPNSMFKDTSTATPSTQSQGTAGTSFPTYLGFIVIIALLMWVQSSIPQPTQKAIKPVDTKGFATQEQVEKISKEIANINLLISLFTTSLADLDEKVSKNVEKLKNFRPGASQISVDNLDEEIKKVQIKLEELKKKLTGKKSEGKKK